MKEGKRKEMERSGWGIEVYHQGLSNAVRWRKLRREKPFSILRHLLLALRAFLRLEVYRLRTGVSRYEAKLAILREAIRAYLANPLYVLHPTA